jgi:exodeoxyribonuclease V beta subunit
VSAREHADWRALPLSGRSLVEASAGTGKTWTIAVLYLRLLLERGLGARQVVVTTFTEAAAQELKERLRARLDWAATEALAWREGGHALPRPADEAEDLRWLRDLLATEARADDGRPAGLLLHRLRLARAELDLAPIGTIHALCRRVLADHPLEAGVSPVAANVVDGKALREELVDDLWRRWTQGDDAPPPGAALWIAQGRAALADALQALALPHLELRGPPDPEALRAWLDPAMAERLRAFAARGDLFARSNAALIGELRGLAAFIDAGELSAPLGKIEKLLAGAPENQFKTGLRERALATPELGWALAAARVLQHKDRDLRHHALRRAHEDLVARRAATLDARDEMTFDDLIERVCAAVTRDGGTLAARLADAWRAALVDECQDTDPRQAAIFDALFGAPFDADGRALVLIGDPKQAIYRFRGGDLHTYLRAAGRAAHRLALARNHRSSSDFVAAVNSFYAAAGDGLLQADIRYQPVVAAGRADAHPYTIDGRPCARPLVLHDRDPEQDLPGVQDERVRLALQACADLVAELLAGGRHRIGGQPLAPGGIAVLLPRNRDIDALRGLLRRRGVPCVGLARDSVFGGEWAWALQVVLHAVLHPDDAAAVRAALATRVFGLDWTALRGLAASEERWRDAVERFHALQATWRGAGVLAVVRRLVEEAAPRLLAQPDGERALTDLRHLGELLAAESASRHGMHALWAWLAGQRRGDADADEDAVEARRLRVESDAARVQLMTLHASKGLEFDVVVLPLMWLPGPPEPAVARMHDPASGRTVADLGGPLHDAAVAGHAVEDQRERARLLYVALTRARHACHVFALPRERPHANRSQPLDDPRRSPLDRLLEAIARDYAGEPLAGIDWRDGWPQARAAPPIAAAVAAPYPGLPPMPAERAPRGLFSFTQLVRGGARGAELEAAADDEARGDAAREAVAEAADPELAALSMVAGAEFGNALHAVLERRDLGKPLAAQRELVLRCLAEWDVRAPLPAEALAARLAARLDAVLAADLGDGLRLDALPASAQRAEMGFDFALEGATLGRVRAACAAHGADALLPAALGSRGLRGLMTGKVDLVLRHAGRFHVLDWKSNRLGESLDDYAPRRLEAAMDEHHYRLQALLYQVALHRHLRAHLPGYDAARDLGAPLYLFVRAVGLAPGAGVWRGALSPALLHAVDAALAEPAP